MESTTRLHPLLSAAAVSVIAVSVVGIAAISGRLPSSIGSMPTAAAVSTATPAVPEPAVLAAPPAAPAAKPKPVKKAVVRAAAPAPQAPVFQEPAPAVLPQPPLAQAPAAKPVCPDCATVEAVREIEQQGEGTWMGPVAGGVGGAILGKQMGKGSGRTIMTVLGAAGGAYAGHEIEKRVRSSKRWEVSLRMDDGSLRSLSYDAAPAWRAGERVRYVNGAILPEQRS